MFETFEHTADLGLRVRAANRETLLADAAHGLFAMIVANPQAVRPVLTQEFDVAGAELDYLLFDWLSELLYFYETRHVLLCEFVVRLTPGGLRATARGEPLDRQRHVLDHEVKAITYHELDVRQDGDGWTAEVIVDI